MAEEQDAGVVMYGYRVRQSKVSFAMLLFKACVNLRTYDDGDPERPNLRKLAESIRLAPMTLINNLMGSGDPELRTLRTLEVKAGIPIEESLVALGVIAAREGEPQTTVSPSREAMLNAVSGLGEDEVRDLARLLLALRSSGAQGNARDPRPR